VNEGAAGAKAFERASDLGGNGGGGGSSGGGGVGGCFFGHGGRLLVFDGWRRGVAASESSLPPFVFARGGVTIPSLVLAVSGSTGLFSASRERKHPVSLVAPKLARRARRVNRG